MAKPQEAVRQIAKAEQSHHLDSGIVRAVRGRYVDVVLDGTRKQIREVILAEGISTIDVGYWVIVVRVPRSNRWTAIAALESVLTGTREETVGLATPSGLAATSHPFAIRVTWDGSYGDVATYELQHNSSASETGATTIKIDGCVYLYLCDPATTRYFRVRAVDKNYKRTGWTSWVNATAAYGESYMSLCITAAGKVSWMAFDWDDVSGVSGADLVHNHHSAIEGGVELWPDRLGVGTASLPAMDGVIGLPEAADRPPFAPNEGRLYCKDVGGVTEFHYEDDQGREIQITDDGDVNAVGAGGNTLDEAYDEGGAGAGRVITADSGAVEILGAGGLVCAGNITISDGHLLVQRTVTNPLQATVTDDATDEIVAIASLKHMTTGEAAPGFGAGLTFILENDTGDDREAADFAAVWDDPTNGAEEGYLAFRVCAGGGAGTEVFRIDGGGLVIVAGKSIDMVTEVNEFSVDGTLAGDSDLAIPTEKAVKAYADARFPSAAIMLWDNSDACPTGFTRVSGADDRYLYAVAAGAGGTGGNASHSHTLTATSWPNKTLGVSIANDTYFKQTVVGVTTLPHPHLTTDSQNTDPLLYKVLV